MRNFLITIAAILVGFYLFSYFVSNNIDLSGTMGANYEYIKLFSADHNNEYCLVSEQRFKYKQPKPTEEDPAPAEYIDLLEILDAMKKLSPRGYDRGTTIVDIKVEDRMAIITIEQVFILDGDIVNSSTISTAEQGYLNITNTLCLNEVLEIDSVLFQTADNEAVGFVDISKPYTPNISLIPTGK